jgi:hypothetical protein
MEDQNGRRVMSLILVWFSGANGPVSLTNWVATSDCPFSLLCSLYDRQPRAGAPAPHLLLQRDVAVLLWRILVALGF